MIQISKSLHPNGHRHAERTWTCSMDMDMDMQHGHEHRQAACTSPCCMSKSMLQVKINAALSMSMLHVQAHAAFSCPYAVHEVGSLTSAKENLLTIYIPTIR
jgi:hypothetical protein